MEICQIKPAKFDSHDVKISYLSYICPQSKAYCHSYKFWNKFRYHFLFPHLHWSVFLNWPQCFLNICHNFHLYQLEFIDMKISKELFKGKTLADGFYPVMIRVCHRGMVYRVSTSVRCSPKNWNATKECIRTSDPQARLKNETVEMIFRRVSGNLQNAIDEFLDKRISSIVAEASDTPRKAPEEESGGDNLTFVDLIDKKKDASTRLNTKRGYMCFRRYFQRNFKQGPKLSGINQDLCTKFVGCLEKDYPENSVMIKFHASRFNAVLAFGRRTGLVTSPVILKPPGGKLYKSESARNLEPDDLRVIYRIFKRRIDSDPSIEKEETKALAWFMLDIAFQGLAPVDLASLKVGDLRFIKIPKKVSNLKQITGDEETEQYNSAILIETRRKKTGNPVRIVAALTPVEKIITVLTQGKESDDYLIPCFFKNTTYSAEEHQNRLTNYFNKMSRHLNNAIRKDSATLSITHQGNVTYYFARHAFGNLVNRLDVPIHIIQGLVGHTSSVLEKSYLSYPTVKEQYEVSVRLFKSLKAGGR